jgi:small subunit ribosomal protein S1
MSWSRGTAPSEIVKTGDEITVKVLQVDEGREKISLGLKQLTADPWSRVESAYEVGQIRTGRVTRVADFGVFVELEPGIEALAHASTFPATGRAQDWATKVEPGTTAAFEILSLDVEKKRIGVQLVDLDAAEDVREYTERAGDAPERFGSLADKLRGALKRGE